MMPARFLTNPRLWNDGSGRGAIGVDNVDDLGFISAMIDFLEAHYAADPARIYCTGFSNGASMTFSVGLNLVESNRGDRTGRGPSLVARKITRLSGSSALHRRHARTRSIRSAAAR